MTEGSDLHGLYREVGGIGSDIKTLFKKLDDMSDKADAHRAQTEARIKELEDVRNGARLLGRVGLILLPTTGGVIGAILTAIGLKVP